MGRRSIQKDYVPLSSSIKPTDDDDIINNMYRKRLRSWKQTSNPIKSTHLPQNSSNNNDQVEPLYRSTFYTYPFNIKKNDDQTIRSESVTTESVFYPPSISYTSMKTIGDLNNNNHGTTLNISNKKRKSSTISTESLSSQFSQIKTFDMLLDSNAEHDLDTKQISNNNRQLIHYQRQTKKLRTSTDDDDSIITHYHSSNSPIFIDNNTIDINQSNEQEPLSTSINNSTSIDTAVKMVQPIVDIIFNAFEDQLKHAQTKPIESSFSNCSTPISSLTKVSPHQIYSHMMMPSYPIKSFQRPIVLHAVNFNIQLATKQSMTNNNFTQTLIDDDDDENNNHRSLDSLSITELKQKLLSYMSTNNFISKHHDSENSHYHLRRTYKLKRIVQLAVFGASVLCGYLLL